MSQPLRDLLAQLVSRFDQLQGEHNANGIKSVPLPSYLEAVHVLKRDPSRVGETDLHRALYHLVQLYEKAWRYHTNSPADSRPDDPCYRQALLIVRPGG